MYMYMYITQSASAEVIEGVNGDTDVCKLTLKQYSYMNYTRDPILAQYMVSPYPPEIIYPEQANCTYLTILTSNCVKCNVMSLTEINMGSCR